MNIYYIHFLNDIYVMVYIFIHLLNDIYYDIIYIYKYSSLKCEIDLWEHNILL